MIVLVGFMGAGKTTVGRLLARQTGLPFADTDELIQAAEGMSVADLFEKKGEPYFREVERRVVTDVLAGSPAVVALGGGAIGDPVIAAVLEWHTVIHLRTPFKEIWKRLRNDESRPLMRSGDPRGLYEDRLPHYSGLAKITVDTEGRDPGVIADEISTLVMKLVTGEGDSVAGERNVNVAVPGSPYDVVVGTGLLERAAGYVETLPEKAFVVTHPNLRNYAEQVAASFREAGVATFGMDVPEGETSKDLSVAKALLERLAEEEAHRTDLVVGVGGGVVTDLAGFVASVYSRGIACLHVPTTLLGQVDAAVGGKTGVNLGKGKNLVGTFHQPAAVVCDISTLQSLPEEELRSGLAEVIKYGLISDPALLDHVVKVADGIFSRDLSVLEEIVARSVWIKAAVVAGDERERGSRAFLNYGHTFAHAIEASSGFGAIRHGEAVAIGMMAAAHTAEAIGWLGPEEVAIHRDALAALRLPVTADLSLESLEPGWNRDKKFDRGVRFVLLSAIGSPVAGVRVERENLESALAALKEGGG